MAPPPFTGFPADGLALLTRLRREGRDWFAVNKPFYDANVATPAKAFVADTTELLRERISPEIVGQPKTNGSISPINNDLRFNPDADPYKDHLLMKWWQGPDKKLAPTLWVRLGEDDVGFAAGINIADVERWRRAVGEDSGAALADAIEGLSARFDLDVAGQALKRVPAPWPDDHPRADLLRHKSFQVRWPEPVPASVTTAGFAEFCADRLALLADVHHWLVAHMG